jgi:hypothetical protein
MINKIAQLLVDLIIQQEDAEDLPDDIIDRRDLINRVAAEAEEIREYIRTKK